MQNPVSEEYFSFSACGKISDNNLTSEEMPCFMKILFEKTFNVLMISSFNLFIVSLILLSKKTYLQKIYK